MDYVVRAEIDSYLRRFRSSLAALPEAVRDKYVDAVRSRLEAQYDFGKLEQEESGVTEQAFTAEFVGMLKTAWPFLLTGLSSRGGLSNWVFFFLPREVVMLDLGIGPAIKSGLRAGLAAQPWLAALDGLFSHSHGPRPAPGEEPGAWQAGLRPKAKRIRNLPDHRIRRVYLRLRALAHQVVIEDISMAKTRYQLMNRDEAEQVIEPLARHFGPRFAVQSTPVFAFCKRYAPFLME